MYQNQSQNSKCLTCGMIFESGKAYGYACPARMGSGIGCDIVPIIPMNPNLDEGYQWDRQFEQKGIPPSQDKPFRDKTERMPLSLNGLDILNKLYAIEKTLDLILDQVQKLGEKYDSRNTK